VNPDTGEILTESPAFSQYRQACEQVERAAAEAIFFDRDGVPDMAGGIAHIETALYDLQQVVAQQEAEG